MAGFAYAVGKISTKSWFRSNRGVPTWSARATNIEAVQTEHN